MLPQPTACPIFIQFPRSAQSGARYMSLETTDLENQQAPKTRWPLVLSAGEPGCLLLDFSCHPKMTKALGDFDRRCQ
jgi:hypothetical protein